MPKQKEVTRILNCIPSKGTEQTGISIRLRAGVADAQRSSPKPSTCARTGGRSATGQHRLVRRLGDGRLSAALALRQGREGRPG